MFTQTNNLQKEQLDSDITCRNNKVILSKKLFHMHFGEQIVLGNFCKLVFEKMMGPSPPTKESSDSEILNYKRTICFRLGYKGKESISSFRFSIFISVFHQSYTQHLEAVTYTFIKMKL